MSADKIKAKIRERDGYKCVKCGMTNDEHKQRYIGRFGGLSLNVHRPDEVGEYSMTNGITVCTPCHVAEHTTRPKRDRTAPPRGYNGRSKTRIYCVGPLYLKLDDFVRLKTAATMAGLPMTQAIINSVFTADGTFTEDFLEILSNSP